MKEAIVVKTYNRGERFFMFVGIMKGTRLKFVLQKKKIVCLIFHCKNSRITLRGWELRGRKFTIRETLHC